jgi:hypothetical protein
MIGTLSGVDALVSDTLVLCMEVVKTNGASLIHHLVCFDYCPASNRLRCLARRLRLCDASKLHSVLVPGVAHDAISHCLMPGSWRVFPVLIAELLVLVLADARDHETFVIYNHRDVSAMDYLMMFVYQHTYAARFCAFRLRCAGVKGSFSLDVALLCRL